MFVTKLLVIHIYCNDTGTNPY